MEQMPKGSKKGTRKRRACDEDHGVLATDRASNRY
jgi:hypothetical protein